MILSYNSKWWYINKLLFIVYKFVLMKFLLFFSNTVCLLRIFIPILKFSTCLKPCMIFHNGPFSSYWRLINIVPKSKNIFLFMFLKLNIKLNDLINLIPLIWRLINKTFQIISHKMNHIIWSVYLNLFISPFNVILFHLLLCWQIYFT